jgi:ABC-2 type transport system permease protein
VTARLASEWLKLRTTRGWYGYLAVVVLFSAIATAGTIGSAEASDRGRLDFQLDLIEVVGVAGLLALLLGITVVTNEFRHGTITPTFLTTPVREHVLAAKALASALAAALFFLVSIAVVAAVGLPWLAALDVGLHVGDGDLWARAAKTLLGAVLWALMGVAVGALVQAQVAALVGTLLWVFVGETLLWGLLGWLDLDGAIRYLPFQALDAADGAGGEDLLPYWAGVAVSLGWIVLLGGLGVVRTHRRDIS